MYRHILIPTDGSELADLGVAHGLSLAKLVGAKVTVVIAEEQVVSWSGAAEAFLRHTEHIEKHATSVLDRVANATKHAGVPCDTTQVEGVQPVPQPPTNLDQFPYTRCVPPATPQN